MSWRLSEPTILRMPTFTPMRADSKSPFRWSALKTPLPTVPPPALRLRLTSREKFLAGVATAE